MRPVYRDAIEYVSVVAISVGLPMAARCGLTRGGSAKVDGGRVVYALRPGMRWLSYALLALGAYLLCEFALQLAAKDWTNAWMLAAGAALCVAGGAFILSAYFVLDDAGLHYFRWPRGEMTIGWDELDHYEIGEQSRSASHVYFFFAKDGRKAAVTDSAYDAADLLRRVQARKAIPCTPYRSGRLYGG